jgi:lipoic acid synthetase
VAEAVRRMRLRHVVITAVARDDLEDGGAAHFRDTIRAVRGLGSGTVVEVLTPDFGARPTSIATVLESAPEIFNHNLETVRRLTPSVRHRATYDRSLQVLREARRLDRSGTLHTKSGLMLGLGESFEEILTAMRDLREVGCTILTLGQYLQPTTRHLPVADFVTPESFEACRVRAIELGFKHVASGPMVRSSYHADAFDPTAHAP